MHVFSMLLCALLGPSATETPPIDPSPRLSRIEPGRQWTFRDSTQDWVREHNCEVSVAEGLLEIRATGFDPYLHTPVRLPAGHMIFRMKARTRTDGSGAIYWATQQAGRSESQAKHFPLVSDGQWHEYAVPFVAGSPVIDLRLDPGDDVGEFDVEWIRVDDEHLHPLVIRPSEVGRRSVAFAVTNEDAAACRFTAEGKAYSLDAGRSMTLHCPIPGLRAVEPVTLTAECAGFPPVRRTVFVFNPDAKAEWVLLPDDPDGRRGASPLRVRVAHDGSAARFELDGKAVALLGPLVHVDGEIPALKLTEGKAGLRLQAPGLTVALAQTGDEVSIVLDSAQPCEGPVVRPQGPMQQALLAGLEYLSRGERSSSTLDIETDEHLRFLPDPLKVTLPLMAVVTDRASVAVTWTDMANQPVFATPNFFDGTDDHRMALRGRHVAATIRVCRQPLEECILWAVRRRGLPPVPPAPRSEEDQWKLCLAALRGPLKTADGWGHCVEPNWKRQPFCEMASTLWRLRGQLPERDCLAVGGSHIANESIFFVTGHARQWLDHKAARMQGYLSQQQPDGSFRYQGKFLRGHFENTASGACAWPAAMLLEYARLTGDAKALAAGLRTLDYMQRFCVPRGAQVWELSLHTPDQLASAYLVWAYVRGYELTGKAEYLAQARRWAASGLPFVYLWGRYPIMLYSTPPVYGATQWVAPNWMGLPVQWVGGVYAYALAMLAPHDRSLDWNHVARGILVAGEQMQYPDGPYAGLLPDSFTLDAQRRNPARINPCALVSLRLVLDGKLDSLAVAVDGSHRVASPFPVTLRRGQAIVRAKAGVKYQLLIDGRRIIDVDSRGDDVVPLD
ncbi:MAG: hypothetical protein ACLQNE_15735 [Thermoguttaceae bacterium]